MANESSKLIILAASQVGYLEKATNSNLDSFTGNAGRNNYTKYARDLDAIDGFYNGKKQGYSWCDVFVDWCFVNAFGVSRAKELLNHGIYGAGCSGSRNYFKAIGRYFTDNPQIGDQIFFNNSSGSLCHTGLVYKVDSSRIYTIEGNTSSSAGVVSNGGCVAKKNYSRTYSRIAGYGRPLYKELPQETVSNEGVYEEVKTWRNGSTQEDVYCGTNCDTKIGSIDAWEKCPCYAVIDGKFLVSYGVDGKGYHKVGFVKYHGGL